MNKPCEHCGKADSRTTYFKCDNPCQQAKQCYECEKKFIEIIGGKKVHEAMEEWQRKRR